jgi:hypothetical protein
MKCISYNSISRTFLLKIPCEFDSRSLRQVGCFLRILRYSPPIKPTVTIKLKFCWCKKVENLCNKLYTCVCFLISKIKGESGVTEQRSNERIQFMYAVKNQNESPIWWAMRLVIMYDVIIFIGNVAMSLTSIILTNILKYIDNITRWF